MFSDAPLGSVPLSSGGGNTWLVNLTEGVGGWAAAAVAAMFQGQVLEQGESATAVSVAFVPALLAAEGVQTAHTQSTLSAFTAAVAERAVGVDNTPIAVSWPVGRSEGAAVTAEGYSAGHVNYTNVTEGALAVDITSMTQLWEFIGTGVNAGWGTVPTGTGSSWTLIKTRND